MAAKPRPGCWQICARRVFHPKVYVAVSYAISHKNTVRIPIKASAPHILTFPSERLAHTFPQQLCLSPLSRTLLFARSVQIFTLAFSLQPSPFPQKPPPHPTDTHGRNQPLTYPATRFSVS